jgi:CYTH domain-containing protein
VVATVRLASEQTPVTLPAWLAKIVVREVTGERELTDAAIAASPPPRRRARTR